MSYMNYKSIPINEIATKANCTPRSVRNFYKGETQLSLSLFKRIRDACVSLHVMLPAHPIAVRSTAALNDKVELSFRTVGREAHCSLHTIKTVLRGKAKVSKDAAARIMAVYAKYGQTPPPPDSPRLEMSAERKAKVRRDRLERRAEERAQAEADRRTNEAAREELAEVQKRARAERAYLKGKGPYPAHLETGEKTPREAYAHVAAAKYNPSKDPSVRYHPLVLFFLAGASEFNGKSKTEKSRPTYNELVRELWRQDPSAPEWIRREPAPIYADAVQRSLNRLTLFHDPTRLPTTLAPWQYVYMSDECGLSVSSVVKAYLGDLTKPDHWDRVDAAAAREGFERPDPTRRPTTSDPAPTPADPTSTISLDDPTLIS